jgi:hypothetical protein
MSPPHAAGNGRTLLKGERCNARCNDVDSSSWDLGVPGASGDGGTEGETSIRRGVEGVMGGKVVCFDCGGGEGLSCALTILVASTDDGSIFPRLQDSIRQGLILLLTIQREPFIVRRSRARTLVLLHFMIGLILGKILAQISEM